MLFVIKNPATIFHGVSFVYATKRKSCLKILRFIRMHFSCYPSYAVKSQNTPCAGNCSQTDVNPSTIIFFNLSKATPYLLSLFGSYPTTSWRVWRWRESNPRPNVISNNNLKRTFANVQHYYTFYNM